MLHDDEEERGLRQKLQASLEVADVKEYQYKTIPSLMENLRAVLNLRVIPSPYSKSTLYRQRICREIWMNIMPQIRHPTQLMMCFLKTYAATTSKTYAYTLKGMYPQETSTPEWREAFKFVCKAAAEEETEQAPPATRDQMRRLLQTAPTVGLKLTLMLMWISCSRYGDIDAMRLTPEWRRDGCFMKMHVRLPLWKSDPYGTKYASKVFVVPGKLATCIPELIVSPPPYHQVYRFIKSQFPELTVHSIRVGSMMWLSEAGFEDHDILTMTQHATPDAPTQVRLYLRKAYFTRSEAVAQARMSRALLAAIVDCLRL